MVEVRNLVLASMALGMPASAQASPLAALQGKARPVVVLSDTPDDPRAVRQISDLNEETPALVERDVKLLREARRNGPLRRTLGIAGQGFAVVLVGKDGEVKKTWRTNVAPRDIFKIIDAMPMRREEMRR